MYTKLKISICKFIQFLFVIIITVLFLLSIFKHCEVDLNTYYQVKHINNHQPLLYLSLASIFLLAMIITYLLLKKLIKSAGVKASRLIIGLAMSLEALFSSAWILFNDTIPHSDQRILFEEARKIVGFSIDAMNHEYVIAFKFQKFIILILALLGKIFGDSQMPFRCFNVVGAVLLILGLSLIIKEGTKDNAAATLMSIVALCFYPITIYTCYLYGTLWAVTSEVWAFYGIIAFINSINISNASSKKALKYGALSTVCFSLGIQMHLSALIGMVAGIIYLVLNIDKESIKRVLALIAGIAIFYLVSSTSINYTYDAITGCPKGDAIPISAKIYMGTTSPETQPWGPGSQDGSYWEIYELNDRNASKVNSYLTPILKDIAVDYLNGQRNPSFFVKKIEYQWLDASIDAHRIILLNNPEEGEPSNSKAFTKFYYSKIRTIAFKLITVFMIIIYGLALISGIYNLLNNPEIDIHFLVQIFVIGGFVFQTFAESASRYIVSYYILLIVEAMYGLVCITKGIDRYTSKKSTKLT